MIKFLRYFFFALLLSLSSYTISFATGSKDACLGDPLTLNYSSTNYTSCTSGVFAIDAPPGYAGLASPNTGAGNHTYNPGNAGAVGTGKVFSFTCGGISPDTATLNVYVCSCSGTNSGTACPNTIPTPSDALTSTPAWTNAGAGSASCGTTKCSYYTAAVVNGSCTSSGSTSGTHYTCYTGTGDNQANANGWDTAAQWKWNCVGSGGGTNAACTENKAGCSYAAGASWTVGSNTCYADAVATAVSGGTATANDATGLTTGSISATCNNGTWGAPGVAMTCTTTSYSCSGTAPSGGNMSSSGATGPSQTWTYSSPGTAACTWSCDSGYHQNPPGTGTTCAINTCGTFPNGSTPWSSPTPATNGLTPGYFATQPDNTIACGYHYLCSGTDPGTTGVTKNSTATASSQNWTYDGVGTSACTYKCNSGYSASGTTCAIAPVTVTTSTCGNGIDLCNNSTAAGTNLGYTDTTYTTWKWTCDTTSCTAPVTTVVTTSTGRWTAPTCPSTCGQAASTPSYTCVGGNGSCSTNSPATLSCPATGAADCNGACGGTATDWNGSSVAGCGTAPTTTSTCGNGIDLCNNSTAVGTSLGYTDTTYTTWKWNCDTTSCTAPVATVVTTSTGIWTAPTCPSTCGQAASTPSYTCVGGNGSCSTNSPATLSCPATGAADCNGACGGTAVTDCAGICGGSAVVSGCDNVCNSTATDWNGATAGCGIPPPSVDSANISGNYTPGAIISYTCSNTTQYYIKRERNGVIIIPTTPYTGPVSIGMDNYGSIAGNYTIYCWSGTYTPAKRTAPYYSPVPLVTDSVMLNASPRTIKAGTVSTITWSINNPLPGCALTAYTVCSGVTCSTARTADADAITSELLTGKTDANDPYGSRSMTTALTTLATDPIGTKAIGKKSLRINYTTDFMIDCHVPVGKPNPTKKLRVQVTNDNEG